MCFQEQSVSQTEELQVEVCSHMCDMRAHALSTHMRPHALVTPCIVTDARKKKLKEQDETEFRSLCECLRASLCGIRQHTSAYVRVIDDGV